MEFYIRELTDGTATLMTYDDLYLFTFSDMESARQACKDWYRVHANEVGEYSSMGDDHVS